ncbi:MAG: cytochrome d ubiquinol oxidase subunit II [Myxococcota bacterium]
MLSLEVGLAAFMVIALTVYALSGGADFGGGVWDLLALGPRARAQRDLISTAVAPIWEANHVWLIAVIVVMFSAFPPAFAAMSTALHIPLTLVLLGIVMRGSAFVFRSQLPRDDVGYRQWSRVFAISSVVTPVMLGVSLGAVASGKLPLDARGRVVTDFISSWWAPFPFMVGLMILALFAYLAAVYLTLETDDAALQDDFRRRALGSAVAVGLLAWAALSLAHHGAPRLYEGLLRRWWSLPLQGLIALVAVGGMAALWLRRYRPARVLAMGQATLMVWGWAFAQYPYLVAPDLTVESSAAPRSVLVAVSVALAVGTALLIPALGYLYVVFKARPGTKLTSS